MKYQEDPEDKTKPRGYNFTFAHVMFGYVLGFGTMFVFAVREIENFKGCPWPEYFLNEQPRKIHRRTLK